MFTSFFRCRVVIVRDRKGGRAVQVSKHLIGVDKGALVAFRRDQDRGDDRGAHEVVLPLLAARRGVMFTKASGVFEQSLASAQNVEDHVVTIWPERSHLLRRVKKEGTAVVGVFLLSE